MKTLSQGTLNVPASGIPTVGESVNALTEQVNNLQRRYYRALAPDCEVQTEQTTGTSRHPMGMCRDGVPTIGCGHCIVRL